MESSEHLYWHGPIYPCRIASFPGSRCSCHRCGCLFAGHTAPHIPGRPFFPGKFHVRLDYTQRSMVYHSLENMKWPLTLSSKIARLADVLPQAPNDRSRNAPATGRRCCSPPAMATIVPRFWQTLPSLSACRLRQIQQDRFIALIIAGDIARLSNPAALLPSTALNRCT
jgi:hypothetical protein